MKTKILALIVTISLGATGCSLLESPEVPGHGVIVLQFTGNGASGAAAAPVDEGLARALPTADSVVVKVYRPGTGSVPEVTSGAAINPPASTTQMQLTVIAETAKRIAVELFQSGQMTFFGVNENVDVIKDQNTAVSISARLFQTAGFWRDVAVVDVGTTFKLIWNSTPGAAFYRLQESSTPDFGVIDFETDVPDTFLQINGGSLPGGDRYFRVAAENIYTQGEFAEQFVHVYSAPVIFGISAPEVMRSQIAQVTVFGDHLDYPGTQVTVFGQTAAILSSAVDQLVVEVPVPLKALSSLVAASNLLGSGLSTDFVHVQTIAYIMDDMGAGDSGTASAFELEIEAYWETISQSAVRLLTKSFAVSPALFDLVIIGWDTAKTSAGWKGFYQSQANAIAQGGSMVLGMGVGGAAYFESIGLSIGLVNTQSSNQSEIYVMNPADDIYTTPNPLNVTAGSFLGVYTRSMTLLSIPFTNGTTPFATQAPLLLMHPLVEETNLILPGTTTNFLWGFNSVDVAPANMTADGLALFENVVVYLFGKGRGGVPLPVSSR